MTPGNEQQRTYDAEDVAFAGTALSTRAGAPAAIELAQRVVASSWWVGCALPAVEVRPARSDAGRASCTVPHDPAAAPVIRFDVDVRWRTIVHELAHAATPAGHGHSSSFRSHHVALVQHLVGNAAATDLRDAYLRARLTVAPAPRWPAPPVELAHVVKRAIAGAGLRRLSQRALGASSPPVPDTA